MSDVRGKLEVVGGWRSEDGVVSEEVRGRRLAE